MGKQKKAKPNGIAFAKNSTLRLSNVPKVNIGLKALQILLVLLITFGAIHSAISGLDLKVLDGLLGVGLYFFVGLFVLVFSLPEYYIVSMPSLAVGYTVVSIRFQEELGEGCAIIANKVIGLYNVYVSTNAPFFLTNVGNEALYTTIFLLFIFCVIIGTTCFVVFQRGNIALFLVTTVPVAFACFIVGKVPDAMSFIAYMIGSIGIIGTSMTAYKGKKDRQRNQKDKDDKEVKAARLLEKQYLNVIRVKVGAIFLIMTTALFLMGWIFFSPQKYREGVDLSEIKKNIQVSITRIENGELTKDNFFNELFPFTRATAKGGLSGGNLGKNEKIVFRNETALEVTAPGIFENTYYLRGYTGSQYKNSKWKQLSKEDQKGLEEIERELERSASSVETLNRRLLKQLRDFNYTPIAFTTSSMTINNVNAGRNNVFVPYNTTRIIGINSKGKVKFKSEAKAEYDVTYNALATMFPNSYLSSQKEDVSKDYITNILKANILNKARLKFEEETYKKMEEMVPDEDGLIEMSEDLSLSGNRVFSYLPEADRAEAEEFYDDYENRYLLYWTNDFMNLNGAYKASSDEIVSGLDKYSILENEYRAFVYQTYTKLPEDEFEKITQLVKNYKLEKEWKVTGGEPYQKLSEVNSTNYMTKVASSIDFVRSYLEATTSYSLEPGLLPKGEDFVDYFLFENKKGYCMHYASAATIMFRAMGIPARYVEGYVVTKGDYTKGKKQGAVETRFYNGIEMEMKKYDTVKMEIKDTNAHAWVEIYQDGFGWIPVEVTPGYSNGTDVTIPEEVLNKETSSTGSKLSPFAKPITPTVTPGQKTPRATLKPSIKDKVEKENKINTKMDYLISGLQITGSILLVVFAMVSGIILRRRIVLKNRERLRGTQNLSKKAMGEYYEISRILSHNHLHFNGTMPVKEYAKHVEKCFTFLKDGEFEAFLEMILKAKFSKEWITQAEYEEVHSLYKEFLAGVYNSLPKRKQFIYKYIKLF